MRNRFVATVAVAAVAALGLAACGSGTTRRSPLLVPTRPWRRPPGAPVARWASSPGGPPAPRRTASTHSRVSSRRISRTTPSSTWPWLVGPARTPRPSWPPTCRTTSRRTRSRVTPAPSCSTTSMPSRSSRSTTSSRRSVATRSSRRTCSTASPSRAASTRCRRTSTGQRRVGQHGVLKKAGINAVPKDIASWMADMDKVKAAGVSNPAVGLWHVDPGAALRDRPHRRPRRREVQRPLRRRDRVGLDRGQAGSGRLQEAADLRQHGVRR